MSTKQTSSELGFSYEVVGSGPLVALLIPGGPGLSAQTMKDSALLFSDLATSYLIDPPGSGQTPMSANDDDLLPPAVADFYAEACRKLDVTPDFVLGESYGGLITVYLAHRHPQLAKRIILVSSVVVGVDVGDDHYEPGFMDEMLERHKESEWYAKARDVFDNWTERALAATTSDEINRMNEAIVPLYLSRPDDPQIRQRLNEAMPTWQFNLRAMHIWESGLYQKVDARPAAREVKCPTLVICGEHDWLAGPPAAKSSAELFANAELQIIKDCGHVLVMEQPQRFLEIVSNWLDATN